MTNNEMRASLKTAKCYNGSIKSIEGWSHKVDVMPDEQVWAIYQRMANSYHIYIEVLTIDGMCIACHNTGKCRDKYKCDVNDKYFDKLADEYVQQHPEHNNAIIAFRFENELRI